MAARSTPPSEMTWKSRPNSLFAAPQRPTSTFTDIVDDGSDWEDERSDSNSGSEFEEESPRGSFDTMTTVDEAPTPRSAKGRDAPFIYVQRPSISGPSGPHLFRVSFDSVNFASLASPFVKEPLQMSPLQSKNILPVQNMVDSPVEVAAPVKQQPERRLSQEEVIRSWSVDQVVGWMVEAGFNASVIDKFEENDINGAVLFNMKSENLKELGLGSFGQRNQVWTALAALRGDDATSPAGTDFEDDRRQASNPDNDATDLCVETPISATPRRRMKSHRNRRTALDTPITPADSVSIVAIEQLMPRSHRCAKGESCPTYQKREKLRRRIEKEMAISPAGGGQILLTGDFSGGFEGEVKIDEGFRNAEPSYVASSDLLGAAQTPDFRMSKDMERKLETIEAQDTVKQYLTLQHMQPGSADEPPSPPLETPYFKNVRDSIGTPKFATTVNVNIMPSPAPRANLQQLPRLTIPRSASAEPRSAITLRSAKSPRTSTASPKQRLRSPAGSIYRVGSPASMSDVPLRSIVITPVERDMSNSVPPNMRFRPQVKNRGSRDPSTWQRASLKLPDIPENKSTDRESQTPIRPSTRILYGTNTTYAGFARKRKTKFLRHEWTEHHMRLKGTQLAMHRSAQPSDKEAIETLSIDEFSVVCAGFSTDSKLTAAIKSLCLSSEKRGKREVDTADAAFIFQLIPEGERSKLLKVLTDMKTHHFAVKSQNERIEWVREVMLAKAKKQKEETGYSIMINGTEV